MKKNIPITDPVWMVDPTWMSKTGGFAKDMTVRDEFAGRAMQGLLAAQLAHKSSSNSAAKVAYVIADAMLKAKEQ
jgi:hypothetical protein